MTEFYTGVRVETLPCRTKAARKSRAWATGVRKRSKKSCRAALAAHEKAQAESNRIRRRAGLAPLPENGIVQGWRRKVEGCK